ncbi:MAG: peptidoglycan bridge formation glycyltransferase FemA/FemB family protein [Chloroflexi bacterium]|nr:peptidoglycan bridge formation glycyltransferase FemA/FemB family protein [Anaerolineae bacterium]MBL1171209.1 peptidoglycan bridge formation glycyltransferase FemA/FemB family protein [Chloroflexota bacterium]
MFLNWSNWNSIVLSLPNPHFLQTFEWGQVKAKYGWKPYYAVWLNDGRCLISDAADDRLLDAEGCVAVSLILKRAVPIRGFAARLSVLYCPKGPLLDWTDQPLRERVLDDLQSFAKKQGAVFLKMDPDVRLGTGVPGADGSTEERLGADLQAGLTRRGWVYSADQIQFRNSVLIDLRPSEEELLARMKQKTRYNVRLAEKKGVIVRAGTTADLAALYRMYAETSVRDGFVIRDEGYYQTIWQTFMSNVKSPISNLQLPITIPLIAEVDGEPVAGLFLYMFAGRAYYVYGMSRDSHREKMPTYLLQWEAMKRAKSAGCAVYDLWGAPEIFDETDSMWGVYRFKEGLGGRVVRTLGAWDYAPNKFWYRMYSEFIPRLLDVMRSRGKRKASQAAGA